MMRTTLMLVVLSLPLAAGAQDIVVSNNSDTVAEAANTPAEEALSPRNRSLLVRLVSYGCTRESRKQPVMVEMSQRTGKDSAEIYCGCMAPGIMQKLNSAHIRTIVRTRKPDPALQEALVPVAQACMRKAGAT